MTTLPIRETVGKKGDVQDTVVIHCAACNQTTASFAVDLTGDYSELNVWRQAQVPAELAGWECEEKDKAMKFICPVCAHRRKNLTVKFPPFSGTTCKCPKCHQQTVDVAYEDKIIEHLRRNCNTCGFTWNEQPAKRPWWRFW